MSHTVDKVGEAVVACLDSACDRLTATGWQQLAELQPARVGHTSAVHGDRMLLVGGDARPATTEWVSSSLVEAGFDISPARTGHCSVHVTSHVILSGGDVSPPIAIPDLIATVVQYSLLDGTEQVLPSLNHFRKNHACGVYTSEGREVI